LVSTADLKIYRTIDGLGGAFTNAFPLLSGSPNNFFFNVPKNELVTGEDYYKAAYLKNINSTEAMDNFKMWLSSKSFPHDTEMKWGFDTTTGTGYHYSPSKTFNGISDSVEVPDAPELDLDQFTLAAWFKGTSEGDYMINKGENAGTTEGMNYALYLQLGGEVRGFFWDTSNVYHEVITPLTYNDGNWHFAVLTYDHANLKVYIDGSLKATTASTATPRTNSKSMFIGRYSFTGTNWFTGELDEIRVWNNDLTSGEVSALYSAGTIPQTSALVYENKFGSDANTNFIAQTIPDKYTAPTGITWRSLENKPETIDFTKINPNTTIPVWFWLHVNANAEARIDDNTIFNFEFDIPVGGTGSTGGGITPGTYHYSPFGTFNGTSDFVEISHTSALSLNQFSIAVWFRTTKDYAAPVTSIGDTDGEEGMLVVKGTWGDPPPYVNYGMWVTDADGLRGGFNETGTGTDFLAKIPGDGSNGFRPNGEPYATPKVNDGLWHLGVVIHTGSEVAIFLDGVEMDRRSTGGAVPATNTTPVRIAHNYSDDVHFTRYFKGDLDEVRIWNNDLTPDEITNLFNDNTVPQSGNIVYENLFGGGGGSGEGGGTGGNPPPAVADYKVAISGDWGCETATNNVINLIKNQSYNFTVGIGDNAYEAAGCWTTRFATLKPNFNSAYGNHEYSETGGVTPYKTFFGHSKTYFTFKFQNIQFFIYDTNISLDVGSTQHTEMKAKLEASQTDNTVVWRVVIFHHPMWGASSDHTYNDANTRGNLSALMVTNHINFVCTGHNHNWQRTKMISGTGSTPTVVASVSPYSADSPGFIHVVTGTGGHDSGGSLYSLGTQPSFQAYQNRTHNGVWEMVATNGGNTLTCSFVDIDGTKFDTFVINNT